jgi:hypothetical protein
MSGNSGLQLSLALSLVLVGACGDAADGPRFGNIGDDIGAGDGGTGDGDNSGDGDGDGDGDNSGDGDSSGDGDGDGDNSGDGDGDAGLGGDGDGDAGLGGTGECCSDGDCLCHGPDPMGLTSDEGPYQVETYEVSAGCVYYPGDAEPPFAAVTISDGFGGSGGCGRTQTNAWGPLYASWGIVTMIVNTTGGDQPATRGAKLLNGVEAFKAENEDSGSPLYQQLAGRYGTSGFSMGGGGTSYASEDDPSLLTSVAIMPWGPTRGDVTVPTLIICGSSDGIASCGSHGTPLYGRIGDDVPKMRVEVRSGHVGQPSAGSGASGDYGLAFQKVFLEGDERWRPFLVSAPSEATTIQ